MELIQGFSFIIALILMPFVCRREPLAVKLLYIIFMTLLTPVLGYPLYRYIMRH